MPLRTMQVLRAACLDARRLCHLAAFALTRHLALLECNFLTSVVLYTALLSAERCAQGAGDRVFYESLYKENPAR